MPDLAARLAQKRAEIQQAEARLHLLSDEVAEQRRRVGRAGGGDKATTDLEQAERAGRRPGPARPGDRPGGPRRTRPRARCRGSGRRVRNAATEEQVQEAERRPRRPAQVAQARADRQAREAAGVTEARLELDRRDRELTEARRALTFRGPDPGRERSRPSGPLTGGLRAEEGYLLVCSPGWSFTARCRAS